MGWWRVCVCTRREVMLVRLVHGGVGTENHTRTLTLLGRHAQQPLQTQTIEGEWRVMVRSNPHHQRTKRCPPVTIISDQQGEHISLRQVHLPTQTTPTDYALPVPDHSLLQLGTYVAPLNRLPSHLRDGHHLVPARRPVLPVLRLRELPQDL
jgi:hypothetical protein